MTITMLRATDAEIIANNRAGYRDAGHESRAEYLAGLADDYGVSLSLVQELAAALGPNEDFDGLVTMLEDIDECD